MKKWFMALAVTLSLYGVSEAKCVNGVSYQLKGYMESDAGIPQTGKTLSEVIFDIKYDDGTESLGNTATAEMINGWYRYSYTSNGKSGIYTMRDSTATYKQFPGAPIEAVCDSQVATYYADGSAKIPGMIAGTASGSSTTTTIIDATNLTSSQAGAYVGGVVLVDGETSLVKSFNPTTDTITLASALSASAASKTYYLIPASLWELLSRVRTLR